jgi:hypothetical protein
MVKVYDVNGRLQRQELGGKLSYVHEAIIDYMIANPTATHRDISFKFKRTVAWIGTITRSDSFRIRFFERRKELLDPELKLKVEAGMNRLMTQASTTLSKQMESKSDSTALKAAMQSFALSAEVLKELK